MSAQHYKDDRLLYLASFILKLYLTVGRATGHK